MNKIRAIETVVDTHNSSALTPLLLKVEEVAMLLGISIRTVWRLASVHDLPTPLSLGRAKRWPRQAIEKYIAGKSSNASTN